MKFSDAEASRARVRIGVIAILVSLLVLGLKFWAYLETGSAALKSDAIESIANVIAGFFSLGAILYGEVPADSDHPFGHGKIENFSAAFEGGMISLASLWIGYEAIHNLWLGSVPEQLDHGIFINLVAGAGNGVLGSFLLKKGKSLHSKALEADGHHIMSDFYTTLGVGAGLLLVWTTGWYWLDSVIALGIGVLLARAGFKLVKDSSAALLDTEDPLLVERIVVAMNKFGSSEIISIHEMKTLRSGRYSHIDVHITVPEFYPVSKAHLLVEDFGRRVLEEAQVMGEFHVHMDPCEKLHCERCALENCPIRMKPFVKTVPFSQAEAVSRGPN